MHDAGMGDALARSILEAAPDPLIVADPGGRVVTFNPAAERFFGRSRAEALGRPLESLLPGAAAAERAILADGRAIPIALTTRRIELPEGPFLAATIRDASARAEAGNALSEAEERFRLTLDEAPIGMALAALDGRFLRVNRAFCELVGYTAEELLAHSFAELTHPDDREIDVALAQRLAAGEIPRYQLEKRYLRKDGSIIHALLHRSLVRSAGGAPLHFISQVQDISERRRAEEALRRSEQRFRDLIDQASDALFLADLDGRYTDVNDAACRMLGYTREELVGRTIADLLPPEDLPRLVASRAELLKPGRVEVSTWRLRRKDGSFVPAEVSAKILSDGRWQAFVRDISERLRIEEALRQSEERLHRAQRVARLGSWEWDLRTNRVTRSPELFELYGVPPGPDLEAPFAPAAGVPPEDRRRVEEAIARALREGQRYEVEHRLKRSDGSERILLQQGEIFREDGHAVRIVGTTLDVTERRLAERVREELFAQLRAVLEEAPVGITIAFADRPEHLQHNRFARELAGGAGPMPPSPPLLTRDGRPVPLPVLPLNRALRGEHVSRTEYLLETPHGRVPVAVRAVPIHDAEGRVSSAVAVTKDLTPEKELERLRAEWTSVVAHDLRQPVTIIRLYADVLENTLPSSSPAQATLARLRAATARLARMVHDLLDVGRIESGRFSLEFAPVDLAALARETVDCARLEAPDRAFHLRVAPGLAPVRGDRDRLAQVLENLLSNAVKYGTPRSAIDVELATSDGLAEVRVTNEGEKLADADVAHLFERFHRTEGAKRRGIKGIGLGLAIVRELVAAHGGEVGVSTGEGTVTFRARLPFAEAAEKPAFAHH